MTADVREYHKYETGLLQAFCVDSVDAESWYNKAAHPRNRAARHNQFDRYLVHEVVPFMRACNSSLEQVATQRLPQHQGVDFGLTRDPAGEVVPRLVEIQGFPSLYAYQPLLVDTYREVYGLEGLGFLLDGLHLDTFLQDVRYAARLLRRNPLFTLTAALSLAIGIGATTTIFAVASYR